MYDSHVKLYRSLVPYRDVHWLRSYRIEWAEWIRTFPDDDPDEQIFTYEPRYT